MENVLKLQQRLLENANALTAQSGHSGRESNSAFIYDDVKMNFYNRSCDPAMKVFERRLKKRQSPIDAETALKELQSSHSSEALLMNIFCHPMVLRWKDMRDLLTVKYNSEIQFGWKPSFPNEDAHSATEVDMKIDDHLFQATLTEPDFTDEDVNVAESYEDFGQVFHTENLIIDGKVSHFGLIKNILAAYRHGFTLTVFLDESRTDLISSIQHVLQNIKDPDLRNDIRFITWQELATCVSDNLRAYLQAKYFQSPVTSPQ